MSRAPTTRATSPGRGQSRYARRRAGKRGAVMVEALIVISLLILGFMGLVFFRGYYEKTLQATRLARGSIIVYSMTGCTENTNEPAGRIRRARRGLASRGAA